MKILFVCSSNVCRSPFAEFVFGRLVEQSPVLSAAGIEVGSSAVFNRSKYIYPKAVVSLEREGFSKEAVLAAQLSRECFGTNFIKLEIHPDPKYLLPDPIETLKATEELAKSGFIVLPYIQADPVLCKRLEDVGTAAVMPLGAPIGTNKGLKTKEMLEIIISQSNVPVVIDAGLGAPSHAAEAMEMGADAVLVNTAIAVADNPVKMAKAFKLATEAGRMAYLAGLGEKSDYAEATSPLTAFLQ